MRKWNVVYEASLAILALLSVALMFVYDDAKDPVLRSRIAMLDVALVVIFVFDWTRYALKQPHPAKTMLTRSWALLGMVPLALPFPDAFRLLRLVRLVRIFRVMGFAKRFLHSVEEVARKSHVLKLGVVSLTITLLGATLVWLVERNNNPDLASFSESLWWAVVTVTTVGYGDITPLTTLGRVIASILMVTGIGTIGLLASTLSGSFVSSSSSSLVGDLDALGRLHESGQLTDEEFAAAKAKLLRS